MCVGGVNKFIPSVFRFVSNNLFKVVKISSSKLSFLKWYTVPKSRSITLKLLPKKTKPIFSTLDTYWTCPHQQILCTSLVLGGAAIIFSQNWNFELKFFLVNPLMQKIGSTWFLDPKKPKNNSETAKTVSQSIQ